ncbi:class I glutamine amidotransferase-like protein [Stachybotrys elegans]|uniref:Class I glutamine amidotransferase-like protein n=1 Tax=Stachybotrys elegans TaxID=80388 RepID=A0A8K0SVW6_9HYPO|nr:class I glutamine amidotransferase-like protein [Stachybotrys elegans]
MGSAAPSQPIRLAVLETDTPQPKTNAKFGGYGGVFRALLAASAGDGDALASRFSVTAHDVVRETGSYPDLDDVDALLLTGSRHNAYDDEPWIRDLVAYTRRAIDSGRVRVVGVCFGHQIIGRAMDAKVGVNDKGWEVAVTDVTLTDKGKELFQLGEGKTKMSLQQMHRDIVYEVPEGATLLCSNAICEVQGLYAPGKYLTVQGHPEFSEDIISEILVNRHRAGIFPDDVFTDAMSRAPIHHDGVAVGKAFLKFFAEG